MLSPGDRPHFTTLDGPRFGQIQIADLRFGYSIDSGTVCSDFFTQKYPPKFTQKFVITKKHTCNMPIHLWIIKSYWFVYSLHHFPNIWTKSKSLFFFKFSLPHLYSGCRRHALFLRPPSVYCPEAWWVLRSGLKIEVCSGFCQLYVSVSIIIYSNWYRCIQFTGFSVDFGF